MRNRFLNTVTFAIFYHAEHHLYPRVPTCRVARLAERIDAIAPASTRARAIGRDAEEAVVAHR